MTKEIIKAIGQRQVLRNHTPVVANITTIFNWELDVMSVGKGGYVYEFEVKISRADFMRDKKKKKWTCPYRTLPKNTPNYFSYACPDGLISLDEIPEFSGLYYFKDGEVIEVREPKLRHNFKQGFEEINMKVARMYSQREFLGRTLISHINKGIREKNAEWDRQRKEAQDKLMQQWRDRKLLNSTPNDAVSDTTGSDSSNEADKQL